MTDTANVEQLPVRRPRARKAPAADPSTSISLAMALGGLKEAVEGLQDDFRTEREASRESRARLHERIDDLSDSVHAIDKKVVTASDVARRLADIEGRRLPDVEAEVAKLRTTKRLAGRLAANAWKIAVTTGGLSAGAAVLWFWRQLVAGWHVMTSLFS